jgi:hypothetical protein
MLSCYKGPYLFNKTINDYCKHSTNESIKRITDRYYLDRNKVKIKNVFNDEHEDDDKPKINIYSILGFLSISTLAFFLYKRIK